MTERSDLTPEEIVRALQRQVLDSLRVPALVTPVVVVGLLALSWYRGELSPWAAVMAVASLIACVAIVRPAMEHGRRGRLVVVALGLAAIAGLFWYGPFLGVGLLFIGAVGLAALLLTPVETAAVFAILAATFPVGALAVRAGWLVQATPLSPTTWIRVGVVALLITSAIALVIRRIREHHFAVLVRNYEAGRALRDSEARFVSVFELAPDALLIVDDAGRIVQANRLAEVTLGYRRDELEGLAVDTLVPEMMTAPLGRVQARRKDGTTVTVEVNRSPLGAGTRLVVAALRDLTERERVEEERSRVADHLRQAQKLEALGTLADGIAHEFNNLLSAIFANLELARGDLDTESPIAENLDQITAASTRAAALVKQILAFSRKPSSIRTTPLRKSISEVIGLLRASIPAGIEIAVEAPENLPAVPIDGSQIRQLLTNLVTNAWQAIDRPTGRIAIEVTTVAVAEDHDLAPGRYIQVAVSDDGTGIDARTLPRIFEPFFTTREVGQGNGLGLSVAHGIATNHGGAIRVTTEVGRGSTFTVYLPEATAGELATRASAPTIAGSRVVVVDDDELVALGTSRLIERLGYRVAMFVRPADAIAAIRATPDQYDLVVTDENMPGIGGVDLARQIAAIRADLPVVLVSGNSRYDDQQLAAARIRFRLAKPYTKAMLREALASALTS